MIVLRLILAPFLLYLMLIGAGFCICAFPIQVVLLVTAGIFLFIGLILREIPTFGIVASAPFFTARWVLEKVMLLVFSLIALVCLPTIIIPGEFLFKGECSFAGYVFSQIVLNPKQFFSDFIPSFED